ncbi:uncharacterized protein ACR2FA_009446 [Aphomia sociella]
MVGKLFCLFFLIGVVAGEKYVYEFGIDRGVVLCNQSGKVGAFEYNKVVNLAIPMNVKVTYVKVIVDALAPPKVEFDAAINQVKLSYSFLQITFSSYHIMAKGQHVKGEQISFLYNGQIPAFTPIYTLNVTPQREDLEKRFTYLRAEYVNPVSKVTVDFDPHKMLLTVAIQFPFFSTPIGVGGYSMPLNKTAVRRYSNCNTFS